MAFVYVSGRPSLDFLGTRKWRTSRPEELLDVPVTFATWAVDAGIVHLPVDMDPDGLRRVLRLREAIYRLVVGHLRGMPWSANDLRILEEEASGPPTGVRLSADRSLRREGDLQSVMSTLARDAVELLGGPDADRIRECDRVDCTRLFIDSSRGGTRRWCGMAECGNRVKAVSYRRRHAAHRPAQPEERAGTMKRRLPHP
ncbi:CGNR zinc finger domain-containing protein [Planotetraspora phitsanulokensis]|uniref:Zinc finger CGNR domain-containing protein n=1 Tax=Planotetraspora phitsanulokensis TaxID=575192 RepID=A0A8J3UBH2_9ACTN|nr:hypothetical protein Pph01_10030 [Planotetraspora phitsanulokensis]